MRRPLVLCPRPIEAEAFTRFGKARMMQIGHGAASMERAFLRLRGDDRPSFVVLFGLAEVLDSELSRGSAFLIHSVCTAADTNAPTLYAPALHSRCLPTPPFANGVECAALPESREARIALALQTHAQLVDRESYTFAQSALRAELPWAIVRAIRPCASDARSCEVRSSIDGHRNTFVRGLLNAIVRQPRRFRQRLALRRAANHALREGAFLADALCCAQESAS